MIPVLKRQFKKIFSVDPEQIWMAPASVIFMGEYGLDQLCLSMGVAVDRYVYVAIRRRPDHFVNMVNLQFNNQTSYFDVRNFDKSTYEWSNYTRALVKELLNVGHPITGFDIAFTGDIPMGCGLNSSGAYCMAILSAIQGIHDESFGDLSEFANFCDWAETSDFIRKPSNLTAPMISGLGMENKSLMVNNFNNDARYFKLPADHCFMVIKADTKPQDIQADKQVVLEKACKRMNIKSLRESSMNKLEQFRAQISIPAVKMCSHIVRDSDRVMELGHALDAQNVERISTLFGISALSLKYDMCATNKKLDFIIDYVDAIDEHMNIPCKPISENACVVMVTHKQGDELIRGLRNAYCEEFAEELEIYRLKSADGVTEATI